MSWIRLNQHKSREHRGLEEGSASEDIIVALLLNSCCFLSIEAMMSSKFSSQLSSLWLCSVAGGY